MIGVNITIKRIVNNPFTGFKSVAFFCHLDIDSETSRTSLEDFQGLLFPKQRVATE